MMACLGCGIPTRGSRCASCAMIHAEKYPDTRGSSTSRGYDYKWQKVRIAILTRDNWTCYKCQKKLKGADATVDHIVPLARNSSLRLDPQNLAACCRSCNSSKKDK